jgi:hypothetical protein
MRSLIVIAFCVILANFIFLSFGYSQGAINIQAIVPQTDKNINIKPGPVIQATTKENKYQYFFEKYLSQQQEKIAGSNSQEAQTVYDKIASWGLMWGIIIILTSIFLIILKVIDNYLILQRRIWIKK